MKFMILSLAILLGSYLTPAYAQTPGDLDQAVEADSAAIAPADAGIQVTVVSIDEENNQLKVSELGVEKTYKVDDASALADIQAGDQVKLTPDQNDASKALSVEKSNDSLDEGFDADQGLQDQDSGAASEQDPAQPQATW